MFFHEGDKCQFVFVLRGIVRLIKTVNKEGAIKPMGICDQHEFFGEDCLRKPDYVCPYDAVCVTTCSLLFLEAESFKRCLESYPDINILGAIQHHKLKTSLVGNKTQYYVSNVSDDNSKTVRDRHRGSFEDGEFHKERNSSRTGSVP